MHLVELSVAVSSLMPEALILMCEGNLPNPLRQSGLVPMKVVAILRTVILERDATDGPMCHTPLSQEELVVGTATSVQILTEQMKAETQNSDALKPLILLRESDAPEAVIVSVGLI